MTPSQNPLIIWEKTEAASLVPFMPGYKNNPAHWRPARSIQSIVPKES